MKERELAEMLDLHVREYVDPALQAIAKRFDEDAAELRAELDRVVGAIPVGKDGADGKDGEPGADGANGVDGKDGTSVTLDDVAPLVAVAVNDAVKTIPAPENGKDGRDGADGKDAAPITAEQLVEALKAMPEVLESAVDAYLAANPPAAGRDGADGINDKDAEPVSDEQINKAVASHIALNPPAVGRDGRDGLPGVKGADGLDGKDGANGLDGLGFDDLTVEDDGDGNATLKFMRGEQVKEFTIRLPRIVDKGVYRPENAYVKGDGVTWGGSFWIAQKDAPEGKPDGGEGWRLAVKRGRDGKDGEHGQRGERGLPGLSSEELQRRRQRGEDV